MADPDPPPLVATEVDDHAGTLLAHLPEGGIEL